MLQQQLDSNNMQQQQQQQFHPTYANLQPQFYPYPYHMQRQQQFATHFSQPPQAWGPHNWPGFY